MTLICYKRLKSKVRIIVTPFLPQPSTAEKLYTPCRHPQKDPQQVVDNEVYSPIRNVSKSGIVTSLYQPIPDAEGAVVLPLRPSRWGYPATERRRLS